MRKKNLKSEKCHVEKKKKTIIVNCDCPTGPTGRTGPTGPCCTGPTGPTGPTGGANCDFRDCSFDASCGGIFPCPPPSGASLTVGGPPGPNNYTTIQDAVNAASSGDLITVFPGTYPEQVVIPVGKNNLTLISQTPLAAVIAPPLLIPPTGSVVTVDGAVCTRISGFTVISPSVAFVGRTGTDINVINGGSAMIDGNVLTSDTTNPITGLQSGRGVNVETGSSAIITGNVVSNYQKTGIRINGVGACASVLNNVVTGVGATAVIAQNGIQISRGATALVQGNTVTSNNYTGPDVVATGILLLEEVAEAPVCVNFNDLSLNNVGLYLFDTVGSLIQGNNAFNNTNTGINTDSNAINNVFIRNVAENNGIFDIADFSIGLFSAMTGNVYLCNVCTVDNKDGAICASTSPLAVPIPTTAQIVTMFAPPVIVTPLPPSPD